MSKSAKDQQYKLIDTETGVVDADPHHLIVMLFKGALGKLAVAKGCMQRNEIAAKGEALIQAISIVGGLLDSVDPEAGALFASPLTSCQSHYPSRKTL